MQMDFCLEENAPIELEQLRDFWRFSQEHSDDYAAVWEAWRELVADDVSEEWYRIVSSSGGKDGLFAPPLLQLNEEAVKNLDPLVSKSAIG